jgi:hypothetical protein
VPILIDLIESKEKRVVPSSNEDPTPELTTKQSDFYRQRLASETALSDQASQNP